MRKTYTFLLVIILVFAICLPVWAQNSYVIDDDGLLTSVQEQQLAGKIQTISQQYDFQPVILTVETLGGRTAQRYAEDYFLDHDLGMGEERDGIVFLICLEYRDWAIVTHGNTRDVVTDNNIDDIADAILSDLSAGNYYTAFDTFLDLVQDEYELQKTQWIKNLLIALLIGAVIAAIVLYFMRKSMNTARSQSGAAEYMESGSYDLYQCRDYYLYSRTTKIRKAENNSSGSRSGGSRGFGGRSGKF